MRAHRVLRPGPAGAARLLALVAVALAALYCVAAASASGGAATYSATQTIAVPPASSFAGSAGGDGWAVALSTDKVYNVFHHSSQLLVACHDQTTAAACAGFPKQVLDSHGDNLQTSAHPGLYLDQATGKLYVYVADTYDSSAGVACFDTIAASSCGYHALTGPGQAVTGGWAATSALMHVGSELYSFNYVYGQPAGGSGGTGAQNRLLCYDLQTGAACAGQPYAVGGGSGSSNTGNFPVPGTAAIGHDLIIPNYMSTFEVGCFDTVTKANCAGAWPVQTSYWAGAGGTSFPLLNGSGTPQGVCFPTGSEQCLGLDGSAVATPAGLAAAIGGTYGWNGSAVQIGSRVYVPSGGTNSVRCYDYSTHAGCANFPRVFSNLSLLYTVNPDPQRPTCLWVNADNGGAQIQSFDAYTGGACGSGVTRVLTSQFVVQQQDCYPTSYTSLRVTSPAPGTYTSGSVQFADGGGNPLPIPAVALDATGTADLSGLQLGTTSGLPQFLVSLNGASTKQLTVTLTWSAAYDPACTASGAVVAKRPTTLTASLAGDGQSGATIAVAPGSSVSASATLAGDYASLAGGTVTYTWYSDSACQNPLGRAETDAIATAGTLPGSAAQTFATPGTYYLVAGYSGDVGNEPSQTGCGDVVLKVRNPDTTPPVTTASAPTGWQDGPVAVTLTATGDLSGVAVTHYTVDGGATQDGTSFTVSGEGTHTVTFWSVDNAGNVETAHTLTVEIDLTPPTTTASAPSGWRNAATTVSLSASDNLSGVAETHYTVDGGATQTGSSFTISTEGVHTVTYWSVDNAGNVEAAHTLTVKIDLTPPTISASRSVAPNAAGWNNTDVTVSFTCGDALSGVASCSGPTTLTEGANQSVTGTAVDNAGNSASVTESPVNIDETAPTVTFSPNGGTYDVDQTVSITCTASDALSGVASTTCADVNAPAWSLGVGAHALTASATDRAGNVGTGSGSYTVIVTARGLCSLVDSWEANGGLANSLCTKLRAAAASRARGDNAAADGQLAAFRDEVAAQSGKSLTAAHADTLAQLSRSL